MKGKDKIPLFQLLEKEEKRKEKEESEKDYNDYHDMDHGVRRLKRKAVVDDGKKDEDKGPRKRANKNAPAEMPSNKPVRRLRVEADNTTKKRLDPRFSDYSGKLNERSFSKNYSFVDDYKQDEINKVASTLKKVKSSDKRIEMKKELQTMKQKLNERSLGLKVMNRLEDMKNEEKEKRKNGKNPYYLKKSVVKEIALEEKYKDLKGSGKLKKFMEKKRRKNASKDRRFIPDRISTT